MISTATRDHVQEHFISTEAAAAQLGVIPRRVRLLAGDGRIAGAVRIAGTWAIPRNFADPRLKRGRPPLFKKDLA